MGHPGDEMNLPTGPFGSQHGQPSQAGRRLFQIFSALHRALASPATAVFSLQLHQRNITDFAIRVFVVWWVSSNTADDQHG